MRVGALVVVVTRRRVVVVAGLGRRVVVVTLMVVVGSGSVVVGGSVVVVVLVGTMEVTIEVTVTVRGHEANDPPGEAGDPGASPPWQLVGWARWSGRWWRPPAARRARGGGWLAPATGRRDRFRRSVTHRAPSVSSSSAEIP